MPLVAQAKPTIPVAPLTFAVASLPASVTQLAPAKGATEFSDDALSAQIGALLETFGTEQKLPLGGENRAEMWMWSGNAYKPGRMAFWRAALQKSLEESAHQYREFDSHEVATNIYEQQFGLAPYDGDRPKRSFWLETGDEFYFFSAVDRASGEAMAGVWVEFKEARRVLLSVLPLGKQAIKKAPVLPAVGGAGVVLVKNPADVMAGITSPANPSFAPRARRAGTIAGQAKDWNGHPLAGATISVQASAVGGLRTYVTTKTNAQGLYSVVLPIGACQVVEAYYRTSYNGKALYLPLRVADGERDVFSSKSGHVENFVLRYWGVADRDAAAAGPTEGAHYFGASMRVQWFTDALPENGTVQITLKPQGPLLGSTPPRTFVVRLPSKGDAILMADHYINNLPIGRYQMTAQILDDGETLPLKIEKTFDSAPPTAALTVDFKSASNDYASQDRSGIVQYSVTLKP